VLHQAHIRAITLRCIRTGNHTTWEDGQRCGQRYKGAGSRQGNEIKVFVTGVTGQLGHDVVIEAVQRSHEVIGSGGRKGEDMKVFVTGVGGQLGHDVVNELNRRGLESIGSDIQAVYSGVKDGSAVVSVPYIQLDITDREAVAKTIEEIHPNVIIHCAAWTAVDTAEDEENRAKVDAINHLGTQYIAEAAKAVDAKMVYISTDYVFDGQGERPWEPDDKCYAPLNVYGQSKLAGELAVANTLDKYFIVRIAWVFGLNGKNFIKTMINVGKMHDTVRVVNDQIGTPTYTLDLARLLVDMVETEKYGYYHATNSEGEEGGYISWYDFCCEFYKQYGLKTKVIPVTTAEYGLSKAARPYNSRLDKSKLVEAGFDPLPNWRDAVKRYLNVLKDE